MVVPDGYVMMAEGVIAKAITQRNGCAPCANGETRIRVLF
jgi:hypothetical protein